MLLRFLFRLAGSLLSGSAVALLLTALVQLVPDPAGQRTHSPVRLAQDGRSARTALQTEPSPEPTSSVVQPAPLAAGVPAGGRPAAPMSAQPAQSEPAVAATADPPSQARPYAEQEPPSSQAAPDPPQQDSPTTAAPSSDRVSAGQREPDVAPVSRPDSPGSEPAIAASARPAAGGQAKEPARGSHAAHVHRGIRGDRAAHRHLMGQVRHQDQD
jgi:hypothetical protein